MVTLPVRTAFRRFGAVRHRLRGFTMVELLTTLVILAVLLAIAAPGMVTFINNSRLRASQGELVSALMLARSEATRRGKVVLVRAMVPIVVGSEFSGGWVVFEDKNGDGNIDADERIRTYPALAGNQRFRTIGGESEVAFNSRGFLQATTYLEFSLCGQTGQTKGYQIKLEPVGLADVKEQTTCT